MNTTGFPRPTSARAAQPDQLFAKRVGLATIGDPRDVHFWSGIPFHMVEALASEGLDICPIGPLHAPFLNFYKKVARIRRFLGLRRISAFYTEPVVAQYEVDLARRVRAAAPDLVFAPAGSIFGWSVPAGTPLVYASDATFRLMDGYYERYSNLTPAARAMMDRVERDTIARAELLLYPSHWAACSAIEDYGADPARVHVIPWGANLDETPDRAAALAPRPSGPLRLLLVGVDWERKGAQVAVDALAQLRAGEVEAELVICGCTPPQPLSAPGLTVIPFLSKGDPGQRARLNELFRTADLFLLPTRAECLGLVFCEAAANGLPSIAPDTGGVSGAVEDGVTGLLLPAGADAEAYAEAIAGLAADPARLARLRETSRAAFEERLNWQAWGARAAALMRAL